MNRHPKHAHSKSARRPARAGFALLLLVAGGTGACTRLDDYTAVELSEPPKRHPIAYTPHTEALLVEVPAAGGLSANQEADVWRFIDRYKKESTGPIHLSAPRSAGAHLAASRSVRQVESILREAGIDPEAVEMGRHAGNPRDGAAVKLAYERPVAVPPQCRNWSTDLGENRERLPYNDFGCATQRNLALTVANARDMQGPQPETPRSSERRDSTWDDYVGRPGLTGGSAPPPSATAPSGGSGAKP
jgi:pilus assembly protein CpaD